MKYVAAGMNPMDLKRGIDKAVKSHINFQIQIMIRSVKLGGLYAHSGLDKNLNHVIIVCDCSNFYYSDPAWTLSHELSHFVLYSLNYNSEVIETLVHRYDNTYDKCRA